VCYVVNFQNSNLYRADKYIEFINCSSAACFYNSTNSNIVDIFRSLQLLNIRTFKGVAFYYKMRKPRSKYEGTLVRLRFSCRNYQWWVDAQIYPDRSRDRIELNGLTQAFHSLHFTAIMMLMSDKHFAVVNASIKLTVNVSNR
jgi:hypothetical protein